MKKWIHAEDDLNSEVLDNLVIDQIVSITLVDDINDFFPRDRVIFANDRDAQLLNPRDLTHDQLIQIPQSERDKIDDIEILRKFKFSELNPAQKVRVGRANRTKLESLPDKQVKDVLKKLKECHLFYVDGTDKNKTFAEELYNKGGAMQDKDARNIIHRLELSDYKYGTRSDLAKNWSDLLLVFRFKGSYTFDPVEEGGQPVTEDHLDLYIKIDVDKRTYRGYCVMSFHKWGEHDE